MADIEGADPIVAAAHELARRHRLAGLTRKPSALAAWSDLPELRGWLNMARAAAGAAEPQSSSAAEWLLDNDYHVQRAILQIKEDMPARFYRRLPGLAGEAARGLPRIYTLAHGLLHASHLQVSLNTAILFMARYQDDEPLSIAELWAFPAMLRLACLEILIIGFGRIFPDVTPPFEVGPDAALSAAADDTECVSRAIANLAVISTIQWKEFFDKTSRVEAILRRDPAKVYPHMDFDTRDRYRHAIEQLSDHGGLPEWEVAERLLVQCRADDEVAADHVGYWLVGDGRPAFEDAIDVRPLALESIGRRLLRYPAALYTAALFLAGFVSFLVPALYLALVEATATGWLLGIALTTLPATILSVTLVNWIATSLVSPRVLPKLDFEKAIADDCRTAVAMPVLVGHAEDVAALLQRLEGHYLANPDPRLQFVLLSDFADADEASVPGDADVEAALTNGIKRLNDTYGSAGNGPFHVLHRPRLYNPAQSVWMGWERKRGKLEQFNGYVLRGDLAPFSLTEGRIEALRAVRFVVTADADTRLPTGVVNRMVATLAHPLNKARFNPRTGRVATGYTILQPRVEIAPETSGRSLFTRYFGGDTAIDIYSRAVSDVYQDLFGSGIYVGKGVYEVASFERSVEGRIPENNLLSHDLFEGLHGRAALASDIIVYEGFPSGYLEYRRRWHRWVRGDWQLLPWLFPFVPGRGGTRLHNRLTWFDRLKIFDNLRRSLVPPSLVALLLGGWFVLGGSPWIWTLLAIVAPAAYLFTDVVTGLARGRRRGVLQGVLRRLGDELGRWALSIAFLISDAAIGLNAILITLWRLGTGRGLLEWTSAAHTTAHFATLDPRRAAWREMWASPAFAIAAGSALALQHAAALLPAAPLLLLWLLAPEIAYRISRPRRPSVETLGADDRLFLRSIARRTWLFFETFVRPEDNWLPPDNYQEPPEEEIAHRTSPTNVGMMVLSMLTAWKLGHIGATDLETRLRNALDALDRLERYRGHMLNWYDTRSLQPLEPRYVSTVDSGNLAVSLVVVSEACGEAVRGPVLSKALWSGLDDTLAMLAGALAADGFDGDHACGTLIAAMRHSASLAADDGAGWTDRLDALVDRDFPELQERIRKGVATAGTLQTKIIRDVQVWLERVEHHLHSMRREVGMYLPWLPLLARAPADCAEIATRIATALAGERASAEVETACAQARAPLDEFARSLDPCEAKTWAEELDSALDRAAGAHRAIHDRLNGIAQRARDWAAGMNFSLLFDRSSRLFHIGYNVTADRIDPHHYDLLASEARLASFFAIAKGDVPPEHWFFLGRPITKKASGLSLVSWNGSMFEYLMPNLFLRSDPETLLGQSDRTAVDLQHSYGASHGIPWGISESAFASMGPDRVYRYHAFGVPGLGLRRGLARDLVVAPYATVLALAARTTMAVRNLRELAGLGLVGRYGFYEAADFTPERVPEGERFAVVRSYMAHHHGMSMAALGNALCGDMFVRWFHGDPHIRTIDLLLNERIPWELPPEISRIEIREPQPVAEGAIPRLQPWIPESIGGTMPLHAIGNGRLTSRMAVNGGGGLSWQRYALTRPDRMAGDAGLWIYVRDRESGALWSATPEPVRAPATDARIVFQAHQVEYHRRDHDIALNMVVGIPHGDDLEVRRITVVNESDRPRTLDFTSYAEVMLAPPLDAARHPVFSKLFVGSELLPGTNGLLFTRRPRDAGERPPVLLHRVIADDKGFRPRGVETDRAAFLKRHGDQGSPMAMQSDELGGTTGWTLDPILAIRAEVQLPPHGRRELAFVTIVAGSRESAVEISERYATLTALEWAMSDAVADTAREMHQLGLPPDRVPDAQKLLSALLQPVPASADSQGALAADHHGRGDLWALGISGDNPILLVRAGDGERTALLRFLAAAQQLWRRRGIAIDLVIMHEGAAGYLEPVRERLIELLRDTGVQEQLGQNGGVHLVGIGHADADRGRFLERAAQIILDEAAGALHDQLAGADSAQRRSPRFEPVGGIGSRSTSSIAIAAPGELTFENGLGGFTPEGDTYVIHLAPGEATPAPWSNVLANDGFGTIVTEAGLGFTWAINSGENRLTPWSNDPLKDPQTEILYLRDEENARLWTPTPEPAGAGSACNIRHGAGYTSWESASEGLDQELVVFVPVDDPVKIVRLRLRNLLPQARRITATYYAEWLLGAVQGEPAPLRTAEYDAEAHALIANNHWNDEFGDRTAFLTSTRPPHSLTTSRLDFLGHDGNSRRPEALLNWDLGGCQSSTGADCCGAFQVHLDLAPGESSDVVFILGQGDHQAHAKTLVRRWQDPAEVERALQECRDDWDRRLGAVTVKTPDPAFDTLVNRWLPYQTTSGRLRARAGFYQASGAFGYRDQLQDVLALLHADPDLARRHILAAAAHQFEEGDVLHWWHPPLDRGVRTHCSDDMLWLPYVTAAYVEATGDASLLTEDVPFLRGPPLASDEPDRYARFDVTEERRTLFEHCERALEWGHRLGSHGLPLIGSGDWNDGMNRVGDQGRGESVWLAWFLIATIDGFVGLCSRLERSDLAERWKPRAAALAKAAEQSAWDGEWYLRAFDDDGRPWGSATDTECQIDSIAQSWAVLSGAGSRERIARAMAAAQQHLVRDDDRLVRLLSPPFDTTPRDPGYIKAYPPGIRENGGQYTHAAAWLGIALARLGDGEGAMRVFDRINPINQTRSAEDVARYRVEPYVVAGDVGGTPPHVGRGGWSWYTGAAGWTWRLAVEEILGLRLAEGRLHLAPCLPAKWPSFEATITRAAGSLHIRVENPEELSSGEARIAVDGADWPSEGIPFPRKGETREVRCRLTRRAALAS
ncbi:MULTISPECIES: GH36-type glycosyl hydrolase domain-containing protein [Sphingomonadaceae]|uniref:GH36-type glycosyl hydrolase domain-containing protein n=1 Tax=Sphingomonadales TaxID=204457 RepID=UPI000770377F|nr:glucoamylase family protein [Sphingobium sp. TKS]AMK22921.1 carbohydrate binding protein [Sphingobium sp. TKS]MCF8706660.1 cellobiose phosphorylase [Rhizorhapis sp. SPR117]